MPGRTGYNTVVEPPPPPPYTPYPTHYFSITFQSIPPPFVGFLPQPPPLVYPFPLILPPVVVPLPSPPSPPPATPKGRPKEPPGAKLDGANVSFDDGTSTYIFPEKHTRIHLMSFEHQPWDHPGAIFDFTVHKTPCMITIKELIRQLEAPGETDDQRGIVECINLGDGCWLKGSVFKLSEDKSKQKLEEIGWNESRGTTREPTWLAVYKA
jgi:hypothetical protein